LETRQRVSRKDGCDLGVVVSVDRRVVKVKWEQGRTSYYRPDVRANVKLAEPPAPDAVDHPNPPAQDETGARANLMSGAGLNCCSLI
jgi:hypothetical protein